MYQSITLSAGVAVEFTDAADFMRVLEAAPTDLQLIFYRAGQEVGRAEHITAGYSERFAQAFDKMRMSSATGGVVEFVTRLGNEVRYDRPPSGRIRNESGAFVQVQATITNASSVIRAANNNRQFLLIQNRSATGTIYINLSGATATTANGVRITAGGVLLLDQFMPNNQITAIGDIASNPDIIITEG